MSLRVANLFEMMKRLKAFPHTLFPALLLAASFSIVIAQEQSSPQTSLSNRTVLLFNAPPLGKQQELTYGDVLSVRIFGHPELSSEAVVDESGMISLPFIEEVKAVGLTPDKLRSELLSRYRKLLKNPQIYVRPSELTPRESVAVYAVYDNRGRETNVYTSMMRAANLKFNWRISARGRGEFTLSFFSTNSFSDGKDTYEVKALLDETESISLGRAVKIFPTVVTAHNDPYLEVRLKVSLKALARMAKAGAVTIELGDIGFKLRENVLEALRFIVSHFS